MPKEDIFFYDWEHKYVWEIIEPTIPKDVDGLLDKVKTEFDNLSPQQGTITMVLCREKSIAAGHVYLPACRRLIEVLMNSFVEPPS